MTIHHCSKCSFTDKSYNKVHAHFMKKHSKDLSKADRKEAKLEKKDRVR